MKDLVAKRYVKALIAGRNKDEITSISSKLNQIASAFSSEKFKSIIASNEVSNSNKVELIVSLADNIDSTLKSFINLLGEKRRFELLPFIAKDLTIEIAKMNNSYVGVVYTNEQLSSDFVTSIEQQFSKKFDVKLSLSQNVGDYDGIKVDIDGLGVEISFSKDRLKTQLIDHILKAV